MLLHNANCILVEEMKELLSWHNEEEGNVLKEESTSEDDSMGNREGEEIDSDLA